jgi:hypothetical protein
VRRGPIGPLDGYADAVVVNYYSWFRGGRNSWSLWRVDDKRVPVTLLLLTGHPANVRRYPLVVAGVFFHPVVLPFLRHCWLLLLLGDLRMGITALHGGRISHVLTNYSNFE